MNKHLRWSGILILVALIFYLALAPAAAQQEKPPAPGQESADSQKKKSEKFVTIDFNDVEISVFIKFISELTGKNFVVDQRVRGKVTILSPKKISETEAYKVFESVLEVHGFATVKAGEIIKIVPAPDARSKSIETQIRQKDLSPDDRMVTQLIPLKYADPNEIKRLLTPLVSKSAVILAYTETNTLIVTDAYSNILRLMKILEAIDVVGIGQELSVIPLEFADAAKFVKLLTTIYTPKQPKKGETKLPVTFVADERTNSLILIASEDETKKIRTLVGMLDKEIPRGTGNIRVYYLEHASAEDLAKVLMEVPSKQTSTAATTTTGAAGATGAPAARKEAPVVSGPVRVTADKATNSLIIIAEKEDYLVIEEIIKKLDIPRSMVYIESLIMEVNVDKQFGLGTDWSALAETTIDGRTGAAGAGFHDPANSLSTTNLVSPKGLALGIISGAVNITTSAGTLTLPNIGAIVQAFKTDQDVHILSTPQILTTDNEEARITVGQNIPFQTRSTVDQSSSVFNSFEYRDVGKILKITPHISKDRMVRLKISLEVTDVVGSGLQPTTSKRTVDTTVIVRDDHTVVIGGLIDDNHTLDRGQVPCLGTVPGAGWLFRNVSERNRQTNLYVFLTPRVVENPQEADDVYKIKKQHIEGVRKGDVQEGNIKLYRRHGGEQAPKAPETIE